MGDLGSRAAVRPCAGRRRGLSSRWRGKDKDAGVAPSRGWGMINSLIGLRSSRALRFGLAATMALWATFAAADPAGTVTGLPLPRYASLKTDRVNLREGPSKDHATKWVYQRAGLPVEITAEFDIWRKVRDSEGAEGWVLHSLETGLISSFKTIGDDNDVLPVDRFAIRFIEGILDFKPQVADRSLGPAFSGKFNVATMQ